MARYTIRKTYDGELIKEDVEILPDEPDSEIAFLGKLYAKKLMQNPKFRKINETSEDGEVVNLATVP